jgi:transcriptional regulator with XRE-family HTH domain
VADAESFAEALRRIRKERGFSLRDLSRAAAVDAGHLCKVENGRRPPTQGVAKAVDRALKSRGELVALAEVERTRHVRQAIPFDAMRRRNLLALGLSVPAIASFGDAGGQRRRVGMTEVRELRDTAARLYGLDHQHGGEALWRAAVSGAESGYNLLENGIMSDTIETQLIKATSQVQMCAGWLAFDAGRQDIARHCYGEALAMSRQVGDADVEAHALSQLAMQSSKLGRLRESMRFAESAARAERSRTKLSTVPHLRSAVALSLSHDASGADKAIKTAREVLDNGPGGLADEWSFLGSAELDGIEGSCRTHLGRPRQGAALIERAIQNYGDRFARTVALYRVLLARARIDSREIDGAAESAHLALDDLTEHVASWRVESELADVATRLAGHHREPEIDRFLARYATHRGRSHAL